MNKKYNDDNVISNTTNTNTNTDTNTDTNNNKDNINNITQTITTLNDIINTIDTEEFVMQPKVDYCFKELMQDDYIRKGFISAVLNIPPEDIKKTILLPTEYNKQASNDKQIILDVRVLLNSKEQLDIEMQVGSFTSWPKRSTYYLSKMYVDQLKTGEDYSKLEKCIHISILNFTLFKELPNFHSSFHLREDTTNHLYTDNLELHVIELPKVKKNVYPDNALLQWSNFFNVEKREELDAIMNKNEYIDKACNTIVTLSASEEKRLEYEQRLKNLRDYNSQMISSYDAGHENGKSEGIEIGRSEGIEIGRSEGIEIGKSEGIEIGRSEGIEIGKSEGEDRLSSLIQLLIKDNRHTDIARITSDDELKKQLYSEYNL